MKLTLLCWVILTNSITALLCYFHLNPGINDNCVQQYRRTGTTLPEEDPLPEDLELVQIPSNYSTENKSSVDLNSLKPVTCANPGDESYRNTSLEESALRTIIAITPTHKRLTQKLDLVSLCHTVMHIPNFLWIVIEDSGSKTNLVKNVLLRCQVKYVHLHAQTTAATKRAGQRGVEQRNTGLAWIRKHCKDSCNGHCNGVVYFMDDDNKYDLRLFHEMRKTKMISVFPVAFTGGLAFEGPICKNGKAVAWQAVWQSKERHVPVDMAAFAINVGLFMEKPGVKVGYRPGNRRRSKKGFMESDLIKNIGGSRDMIECRGPTNEVLVWHVKTTKPFLSYKNKYPHVEV